jgi:glucokinase
MSDRRLVIDIGGSNVRFARAASCGELYSIVRYGTADFTAFADALGAYFAETGPPDDISECAIAAAGPVDEGFARLTNAAWSISRRDAARILGQVPVVLVNDLEAVAAALPHLTVADVTELAPRDAGDDKGRSKLAFNIGTGCGAAVALFCGGAWRTAAGEAGHMSLVWDAEGPAPIPRGVTVEDVLSGSGVAALYASIAALRGVPAAAALDATAILAGAGDLEATRETMAALSRIIGRVAGDLVLATGAWGGVYFVGSVATAWARSADMGIFRTAFENKGKMQDRMRRVPSRVVTRKDIALFGLAMLDMRP